MPQYIQLPNGAYFEVKEGERPEDALVAAASKHPEAFQKAAPPPEPPKEQGSYLGDLGRSFASGAVGATGALTSVFGADNAASRYLAEKGESLQKGLSTSRQAELQAQAERMKAAEASGSTWEEVKAGLLNVIEAPLQTTASALGSFAPMVATLPLAKLNLGARAIMAVRGAIGGAQGAGAVKQNVYEAVLQAEQADGKSPEQAQAAAVRAQSYVGENLDQILLGGGLGVAAGTTGAERLLPGGVRAQAGAAQQALTKKIGERGATAVTAAAGEMPLEGLQGGQERLAANLALQRTGRDVDTFAGVAGQATQEALAGGLGGAAVGVSLPDRSMSIAARKAEEERRAQEAKKEADYKASDEYALDIASKYENVRTQLGELEAQKRKAKKGSPTFDEDVAHNKEIGEQQRALREESNFKELSETYKALGTRLAGIEASRFTEAERNAPTADKLYVQSPQETIPGLDAVEEREAEAEAVAPEKLMEQRQYLDRLLEDNQERMSSAAANADVGALKTLQQQRSLIKSDVAALDERLKATGFVDTAGQTQQLQQEIAKAQQQLQKMAGPGFDPDKAAKLIERIERAQTQLAEVGGDQQALDLGTPRTLSDPRAEGDRFELGRTKQELAERQDLLSQQRVTPEGQPDMFAESMDEVETQRREGETNFDYLDDIFVQALNQEPAGVAPPEGVARSEKAQELLTRLDSFDQKIAEAKNEKERQDLQAQRAALANAAESDASIRTVYDVRNQAEEALLDLEGVLDDFRTGSYFGAANVGAASTNREGLNKRAADAKQAYIRAVLQEAAALRSIRGEPRLTTDEALSAADQINSALEELVVRVQSQRGQSQGLVVENKPRAGQEVRNARAAVESAAKRVEETRKEMRAAAQARNEQQQQALEKQLAERMLALEQAKKVYADMPKQVTQGGIRAGVGDTRPLEERPFGKYRAALGTILEGVEQTRRSLTQPVATKPRAAQALLKTQFADTEAQRTAEARGETATTLGGELRRRTEFVRNKMARMKGPMRPAVSKMLNKAVDAMDAGRVTRDLLDAVEPVVDTVLSGQMPYARDLRAINDALLAMEEAPAGQQDLFTDPEERAQRKKVEGVVFPTAERFENSPIIKYARTAVDRARAAQDAFRKTLQKFSDDRRKEAQQKEDQRQLARQKKETRLRNQIKDQREDYAAAIQKAQADVRSSMQAAKMALAEPKLKAAQEAIQKAQKDLNYQQQRLGLYADDTQSPDRQRVMRRIKKAQGELADSQAQLDALLIEATSPVDEFFVQEQAAHDDNVKFERAVLDKLLAQADKMQAADRSADTDRGQEAREAQQQIADAANAQREALGRAEAAQRAAAEKASIERAKFKERLAQGLGLPSFSTAGLPARSALRARIDAIEATIGQPSEEVAALQQRLEEQKAQPKDRNQTRRIRYTENALELAQAKHADQQEEMQTMLRELKAKLSSHQTLTDQQRAEERAEREAQRSRTVDFDPLAEIGIDRTKRATGPVTKAASAAPSQLRSGSTESREGATRVAADQRLQETRKPKERDVPVAPSEMAEANRIADMIRKKTPAQKAKEAREAEAVARELEKSRAEYSNDDLDSVHYSVVRNSDYDDRPTTALPTTVKAEIRDGNLEDAVLRLQDEGSTPFVRELAKRIAPFLKGVSLVSSPDLVDSNGVPVEALYIGNKMQVQISTATGLTEEAFLHEIVHPATLTVLKADPATLTPEQRQARQDLEALFARIKADPKFKREYAEASVDEMVAEIMSNNKLRNMLDERGFLQRVYDAFLRLLGFTPKQVSQQAVADIYKLFAPAQPVRNVVVASLMRGIIPGNKAKFNDSVPQSIRSSFGQSAQPTKFGDMLSSWSLGLRVKALDAWGAREALVKLGLSGNKLTEAQATQTRIIMRLNSEANRFVHQAMLSGPLKLSKDEKGYFGVDVDEKKPSIVKVLDSLRAAVPTIGNMKAVEELFYKHLQIKRVEEDKLSYSKINMEKPPDAQQVREFKKYISDRPAVKAAFDKAEREYREYNGGMLDFAHSAGVFTDKEWQYFKKGSYVPFYRQTEDGNIEMIVGDSTRTIGNVIQQPQLKDLVGGSKDFLGFTESVMQNAQLLTRMSLQNLQARDVGFMLNKLGMGKLIKGEGVANTIRFKINGENMWVKLDTDLFPKDIPAELLLQGLHGIKTAVPTALKMAGIPTQVLRSTIVRMPLYMIRQMIRDPLHAWLVTGLNFTPIVSSIKELTKIRQGLSPTEVKLMRSGAISSNVMTGDYNDAARTLRDLSDKGTFSWNSAMQSLDNLALQGDSATRAVLYDKYREQGMSHFEAALGAAEVMNFSRRGTSSSLYMISTLIPFFNAQLQGIDSVWRSGVTGDTVFEDKLQVRQKLYQRAALMMGITLAYAVAMQDDEAYKNATPQERAMNWFIPLPGADAALRVPIPFEMGAVSKAIPELLFNAAFNDADSKDTLKGLKYVLGMSIPGDIPTIAKPAIELATNYSFFRDAPIETARDLAVSTSERYRPNTTELAKLMGQVGVSPLQVEHLVRGYFSNVGIMAMSMANPVLRPFNSDTAGEPAERRLTETPFFGAAFQPNNGRGVIESVYDDVEDWQRAAGTFKRLVTEGKQAEARAFADKYAREIALSSAGGSFKQTMGELAKMRRAIQADPELSATEKRSRLTEIEEYQKQLAAQIRELSKQAS